MVTSAVRIKTNTFLLICSIFLFSMISGTLNACGLGDSYPWVVLLIWVIFADLVFLYYVRNSNMLYANLIVGAQILKTVSVLALTLKYGIGLNGFLNSDAATFARIAGMHYWGEYSEYSTNYPLITSKMYCFFGANVSLVVFFNSLFVTTSGMVFSSILSYLKIKKGWMRDASMCLVLFSPFILYYSFSYMREPMELFFLTLSISYFIKYLIEGKNSNVFMAVISSGPALYLHGGYAIFTLCYVGVFCLKNLKGLKIKRGFLAVMMALLLSFVFLQKKVMMNYIDIKGSVFSTLVARYELGMKIGGGSLYTDSLVLNNPSDIPLYLIGKTIYFLFSPTPNYWRNKTDLIVFFVDSVIAMISLALALNLMVSGDKKVPGRRAIIESLLLIILLTSIVFGADTNTAGTAIRHRIVFIPLYGLIIALHGNRKESLKCAE